jgi:hypothetical protein
MTEFESKKAYNPNQYEGSTHKDNFAFPAGSSRTCFNEYSRYSIKSALVVEFVLYNGGASSGFMLRKRLPLKT